MGKISVNAVKGRLFLLGNLPHRDGSPGRKPTRIALRMDDTPADRKVAEKKRAYLQRQVDQDTFNWDDWHEPSKGVTWQQAINALYKKRVVLGRTGESTWQVNYMGRLRQLDMRQEVNPKSVAVALNKYERSQCSYKELYYLMKDICTLVAVPFPEIPVPTYETSKVLVVPDDPEIIEWVQAVRPVAGWYFGMMATYGLRPHEVDQSRFIDDDHNLHVSDKTKTGERVVVPLHKDWVELFDLRDEKRRLLPATGNQFNAWLHAEKKWAGIEHKPYTLRHAYAARLWRVAKSAMDIYTAARLMGHSTKEHERTYRAHIAPYTIAKSALDAIAKGQAALANEVSGAASNAAHPDLSKR